MNEFSSSKKYKISLDFHGVLDAMPDFFSFLTNAIVSSGGEVHIVTGGSWTDEMVSYFEKNGIKFTHHFSVYDYLIESKTPIIGEVEFPDGKTQKKFENGSWDKVKGEYCKRNGISLHFDDTLIYNDFFETPFCRLWSHNGFQKKSHKDIRLLD